MTQTIANELTEMMKTTVQFIAMQIAGLGVADREKTFELALFALAGTIHQTGVDPSTPSATAMIEAMCEGIRTVAQMPEHGQA